MSGYNEYAPRINADGETGYIWLQYCGWTDAVKAKHLQPGDILYWNGGHESTVIEQIKDTPAFVTFKTMTNIPGLDDGPQYWERRLKKDRLVACSGEVHLRVKLENRTK